MEKRVHKGILKIWLISKISDIFINKINYKQELL